VPHILVRFYRYGQALQAAVGLHGRTGGTVWGRVSNAGAREFHHSYYRMFRFYFQVRPAMHEKICVEDLRSH